MIKIRRGSSATITDALVILGSKGSAPGQLVDSQTLKVMQQTLLLLLY
jgi:hypothetical protein